MFLAKVLFEGKKLKITGLDSKMQPKSSTFPFYYAFKTQRSSLSCRPTSITSFTPVSPWGPWLWFSPTVAAQRPCAHWSPLILFLAQAQVARYRAETCLSPPECGTAAKGTEQRQFCSLTENSDNSSFPTPSLSIFSHTVHMYSTDIWWVDWPVRLDSSFSLC